MVKKIRIIAGTILLFCLSFVRLSAQEPVYTMERLWETPPGLQIPESVIYDDSTGIAYVSNIVGSPSQKDGKGFISKINTVGQIIAKEWVTGIDAPKGMVIVKNKLYVTNIDEIIEIDLKNATIDKRYPVDGATFLNDIASDENGYLYFTDTKKGSISILANGKIVKWLEDKLFEGANGLYFNRGILYIGTSKGILKADIKTGNISSYIATSASVDGLFVTQDKKFVYSDWVGNVYITKPGKKVISLLNPTTSKENAADFCVIPSKKLILIPTFSKNTVVAYKVNFLE